MEEEGGKLLPEDEDVDAGRVVAAVRGEDDERLLHERVLVRRRRVQEGVRVAPKGRDGSEDVRRDRVHDSTERTTSPSKPTRQKKGKKKFQKS